MTDLLRHCGPGVPAPCGCLWEAGTVYPCVEHATPHERHASYAPFCDLCQADMAAHYVDGASDWYADEAALDGLDNCEQGTP
jgi:hypothetical protein